MKLLLYILTGLVFLGCGTSGLEAGCKHNEDGKHKRVTKRRKPLVCLGKPKVVKNAKFYNGDACKLCGCSSSDHVN